MNAIATLFINFAATALVEGAAVRLFVTDRRLVYYSVLCNLLTNPMLNALLSLAVVRLGAEYAPALLFLELAAVITEAVVYRLLTDFSFARALALSLVLNALSYSFGAAFWWYFS